jgi:hypothetical protein
MADEEKGVPAPPAPTPPAAPFETATGALPGKGSYISLPEDPTKAAIVADAIAMLAQFKAMPDGDRLPALDGVLMKHKDGFTKTMGVYQFELATKQAQLDQWDDLVALKLKATAKLQESKGAKPRARALYKTRVENEMLAQKKAVEARVAALKVLIAHEPAPPSDAELSAMRAAAVAKAVAANSGSDESDAAADSLAQTMRLMDIKDGKASPDPTVASEVRASSTIVRPGASLSYNPAEHTPEYAARVAALQEARALVAPLQ